MSTIPIVFTLQVCKITEGFYHSSALNDTQWVQGGSTSTTRFHFPALVQENPDCIISSIQIGTSDREVPTEETFTPTTVLTTPVYDLGTLRYYTMPSDINNHHCKYEFVFRVETAGGYFYFSQKKTLIVGCTDDLLDTIQLHDYFILNYASNYNPD